LLEGAEMPRPVYVLLAEAGHIDRRTNLVSVFNIVEVVEVSRNVADAPTQLPAGVPQTYNILAAWMKEDGDASDDVFESQLACLAPDGTDFFVSPVVDFNFNLPYHRVHVREAAIPGFPAIGVFVIEARLRRAGQEDWQLRQQFPFFVREIVIAPTTPAQPPAAESTL
jgi:hypothetical protein